MKPTIRKRPADSVPYGTDISRRGGYVYCAYDGEQLIAVAATAKEARSKYARARAGKLRTHASHDVNAGRQDKPHPLEPGEPLGTESTGEYARRIRKGSR